MFDFMTQPALNAADLAAYDRASLREERDDLAQRMMLNTRGKARLAELNRILGL